MASPFSVFRSNLKPLMVALTLLALFAFVVLPAVQMYQQANIQGDANAVLATYNGGTFEADEINFYNRTLGQTNRFLAEVAQEVVSRGGSPDVPGYGPDSRGQMVYGIGRVSANPQAAVITKLYAKQAVDLGFELDDTAVGIWLEKFTDGKLSDRELSAIRARTTQNTLGRSQMINLLRTELLAQLYMQALTSGITTPSRNPIVTPAAAWQNFRKLHQQATVTTYPVLVEEYLDKVGEPSQAAVQALFEAGRERFSNPRSPEPGFRRRYSANIEYVAAHLEDFLARETAKLTEEELRAEYNRRLAGGEFTMPPLDTTTPPASEEPATEEPATEEPATEEPATEEPVTEEPVTEEPVTEEPATEEPVTEEPVTEEPVTEEPATEEPATGEPATEEPATEEPVTEELGEGAEAPADSSAVPRRSAIRLVALQDQDAPPAETGVQDEAASEEPAPAAENTPAEEASPAQENAPADADTPAEENASGEENAPGEKPAPAAADSAADSEAVDEQPPAPPSPPATPRSFEEMRDEVARSLASNAARKAMESAIAKAYEQMRSYFTSLAVHESQLINNPDAPAPKRLDLKALADRLGLRHGTTGMQDELSIQETPLGGSTLPGGERFTTEMFSDKRPQFSPVRSESRQAESIMFSSWKTEIREGYVPELDEVREEVVAAARLLAARDLARAAAEELAKQANANPEKPLEEVVPDSRANLVQHNIGPFPWMRSFASMGLGMSIPPFLAPVPGLDDVGHDFMRAVFNGPVGEYDVAPNTSKSVYYVVKATEISPPADELFARFMQENQRREAVGMAQEDATDIQYGTVEKLEETMGLKWNEEALR